MSLEKAEVYRQELPSMKWRAIQAMRDVAMYRID